MENNYLSLVNSISASTTLKNNTQIAGPTLPATDCTNGLPNDKYKYYGGRYAPSSEVLYSIYESFQTTFTPTYLNNKYSNTSVYNNGSPNTISALTGKGPANIFIVRHGEKTTPGYELNGNGVLRACKIPEMINWLGVNGYPIDYIISCNAKPFSHVAPSIRPEQTIMMSAFLLNLPLIIYGFTDDTKTTAQNIMTLPEYDGVNIFIGWEHNAIQSLLYWLSYYGYDQGRIPSNIDKITGMTNWWELNTPCEPLEQIPCVQPTYTTFNTNTTDAYGTNNLYTGNDYYDEFALGSANLQNMTKYFPYWNTYNFNEMVIINGYNPDTLSITFSMELILEPINTCYSSTDLNVCMFQPQEPSNIPSVVTQVYSGEKSGLVPPGNVYPSKYTVVSVST